MGQTTRFFENFSIHTLEGQISTLVLGVYPDKILILDGGCSSDARKIENYIRGKLRRSMNSVKLVIASHAHPDHAGGAHVLSRKYGLRLAAPRHINKWYRGPWGCVQHKVDTMLAYHVARTGRKPFENLFFTRRVVMDDCLDEGTLLTGFEDWQVFDAPGHTSHDIVMYNKDAKALYVADVVLCVNGKFLLPFPVPMEDRMKQTLKRISELEVETVLMAHGGLMKVRNMQGISRILLKQLIDGLPPALEKMKVLESFSPEIRKLNKNRRKQKKDNPFSTGS